MSKIEDVKEVLEIDFPNDKEVDDSIQDMNRLYRKIKKSNNSLETLDYCANSVRDMLDKNEAIIDDVKKTISRIKDIVEKD